MSAPADDGTIETTIRYAAWFYNEIGLPFPRTRMLKIIRRAFRDHGPNGIRQAVDAHLRGEDTLSWRGYQPRTYVGYKDTTGALVARRVDYARNLPNDNDPREGAT
ncbi:MAG: hypothetical protein ACRDT7_08005 [Microbacterium sp.]